MTLPDDPGRRVIRTALEESLFVEAAAGTGKTTELVRRLISVLAEGRTSIDRVVAVTFTDKAAGELKLRLRAELEEARAQTEPGSERRRALETALQHLEEARIQTIHGFCADLLRERPVEARVDPAFEQLDDASARRLFKEAFQAWLSERLAEPPEGVRRSLRRTSRRSDDDGPIGRLEAAAWELVERRDFPAGWERRPFDRSGQVDGLVERLHAFGGLTERVTNRSHPLYRDTEPARHLSRHVRLRERVARRDYDWLEAALVDLASDRDFARPRKGYSRSYGEGVSREDVFKEHAGLVAGLQAFQRAADADLAAALKEELQGALEAYEARKTWSGRLDFLDLLLRARDLVRDEPQVRADFQARFSHLFIDEFQDTDPLQAEILLLLSADDPGESDWRRVRPAPGKLFIVGDPKQSIYRFRRADVGVYEQVKELLRGRGARYVQLTTSFRSLPPVQRAVNAAFEPVMTHDPVALQPGYVPLTQFRPARPDQPAMVALPVPRPYGTYGRVTQGAIKDSLPDAVGAFVAWLVRESGWKVQDPSGELVPVGPGHVCLLFRAFQGWEGDLTRPYVEALEARGVPHLLVGGKSFHEREEVESVRVALQAVEWPDDELAVFATLKGPLFAIGDAELLEYRTRFGRLHPFRLPAAPARAPQAAPEVPRAAPAPVVPEPLEPIVEALTLLARLHRRRSYRPVAETVDELLQATRAHASLVLRPGGEQALANVLHLLELARQYEAGGGLSFRGFVDQLREEAERGGVSEAPILEEASEGVRLMTVHKAKGLEFPVVVLADLTSGGSARAERHVDAGRGLYARRIGGWAPWELLDNEGQEIAREEAEQVRLAYVAATRARDLLVIPAVGDEPFQKGWLAPLNEAIYPPARRRAASGPGGASSGPSGAGGSAAGGASQVPAPGCPPFGADTVLDRPPQPSGRVLRVRPGRHVFRPAWGEYEVVWWDPAALGPDVEPRFGLRREELIQEPDDGSVVEADLTAYLSWEEARRELLAVGGRPSLVVWTATQRAAAEAAEPAAEASERAGESQAADGAGGELPQVEVVEAAPDVERPAGLRFGRLVHAVLATVPLDGDPAAVRAVSESQGRVLGAPGPEVAAAAEVVSRVLSHPLLERARAAAGRRRETPVSMVEADGSLVEGVVDLAFLEDGAWTVVDFKTDRELAAGLDRYRRQVGLYAAMIARATGQPARAVLMPV